MENIDYGISFLLSGKDLVIADGMVVRHPKLGDILDLGYGYQSDLEYWMYVGFILCNPYESMVELDDDGLDYRKMSSFDVFVWRWSKINEQNALEFNLLQMVLSFFFGEGFYFIQTYDSGESILVNRDNPKFKMDSETFQYAIGFLEKMHCIDRENEIKPKDDLVYKSLVDMKRRKQKRKRRHLEQEYNNTIGYMQIILSAGGVVSLCEQWKMGIYAVLRLGKAVRKKEQADYIKSGMSSGNIDSAAVPESIFNWFE